MNSTTLQELYEAAEYIRMAVRLLDRACYNPEVCEYINALPENQHLHHGFADSIKALADRFADAQREQGR